MEGTPIQIILSERGKELALVNLYKYKLIGERKKDYLLRWRCTNNQCSAIIFSGIDKSYVVECSGQHNHVENLPEKIENQILRESCKRKAEESITTRPIKIIRAELLKSSTFTSLDHQNLHSVRKAMYEKRKKKFSRIPKSFDEAITQLQQIENEEAFKFQNQKFIHMPVNDKFVCLTTEKNVSFMVNHCTEYFGDGIFNYAPKYFIQLYTIHGFKNGYYLALVYFFLQNKTKSTYIKMWQFLPNLCLELCHKNLKINTIHTDFELGAHQAIHEVFGDVKLVGCRFHLGQSWWRKIVNEPFLRIPYTDKNNELGRWLKMFFGLPFLSSEEVGDAFTELISVCPNSIGHSFSDYIYHNYIENDCHFPPNMWAEIPSHNPRTTNAAESFHRTYNSQFYSPHPHIYAVIGTLLETQTETTTKINSITQNKIKLQNSKELKIIEFNIKAFN